MRPALEAVQVAGARSRTAPYHPIHVDLGHHKHGPLESLARSAAGRVGLHALPYLLAGQTWGLLWWGLHRLLSPSATPPDVSGLATVPGRMVVFHALILSSGLVPAAARMWLLSIAAAAAAIGLGLIDVGSAVLFLGVCLAAYPLLKLDSIPRWARLSSVFVIVALTRMAAQSLGFATLARPDIAVGFLVCFWYACYAMSNDKRYGLVRHVGYMQVRLFTEGPVFPPDDAEPADRHSLLVPAIRALSVAMVARSVSFHLHSVLTTAAWQQMTGASLLGMSYLNYIALSCELVFGYNLAVGLLRLAGLPIRDNFGAWILACTPNDHWRRWNLLYREWILTFTFYPLMRARRGLFVCVMAALLASGLVHLFAQLGSSVSPQRALLTLSYWTINGLAIYAVLIIPRRLPRATQWLRLGTARGWMVIGWLVTSTFYSVLFFVNHECHTFAEVGAYLARLIGRP